jgi:very-short-patch-repair endonuclease
MKKRIHNLKYLEGKRKKLRNNLTSAEAFLWKYLQKRKLEGRKFRRQHSIENYIVDFYCAEEKLIIELDGQVHFNVVQQEYDEKRTKELEDLDFKVIRFENKQVFEETTLVLKTIKSYFLNN